MLASSYANSHPRMRNCCTQPSSGEIVTFMHLKGSFWEARKTSSGRSATFEQRSACALKVLALREQIGGRLVFRQGTRYLPSLQSPGVGVRVPLTLCRLSRAISGAFIGQFLRRQQQPVANASALADQAYPLYPTPKLPMNRARRRMPVLRSRGPRPALPSRIP